MYLYSAVGMTGHDSMFFIQQDNERMYGTLLYTTVGKPSNKEFGLCAYHNKNNQITTNNISFQPYFT